MSGVGGMSAWVACNVGYVVVVLAWITCQPGSRGWCVNVGKVVRVLAWITWVATYSE